MGKQIKVARHVRMTNSYGRGAVRGALEYLHAANRRWWMPAVRGTGVESFRKSLEAVRPDGVLLQGTERHEEIVRQMGLPAVNVSSVPDRHTIAHVGVDNVAVGRLAAEHLIHGGLRHFAFVGGGRSGYARQRTEGFAARLSEEGYTCERIVSQGNQASAFQNGVTPGDHEPLADWLAQLPKPLGVMAVHDQYGVEVVQLCGRFGLRVPEDVAIVGVDNDDMACELCFPPLSSVETSSTLVGYRAAEMLDAMIRDGQPGFREVPLPPTRVVARASSDILAVEDDGVAAAVRFIRAHADKPLNVSDVVDCAGVNRRTLEMHFRAILGRTPLQEIHRAHIERAKSLLANLDIPISQVAGQSGFRSPQRFAVVFNQAIGMTPTDYRRQFSQTLA